MNWFTIVIVNPILGTVGIVGNVLNCVVLKKSGFNKPSNIFLFGLAVSDVFVLLGAVDVVSILTQFPKRIPLGFSFWEFDCSDARMAVFYLNVKRIVYAFQIVGMNISPCFCVVITLERLVAIFFPLQFSRIIRPRRAWTVVTCSFLFWAGFGAVFVNRFTFVIGYWAQFRSCVCKYALLPNDAEKLFDKIATWFVWYIALGIIILGSVVIFARIKVFSLNRRRMTSSKSASSSRTTRTLLAVCVVFSCTQIVRFPYVMFKLSFSDYDTQGMYVSAMALMSYVNSACNFVIYILLNKKFRTIL
ncbi:unnamed protein product, partial [Lymnaea stagnalis]